MLTDMRDENARLVNAIQIMNVKLNDVRGMEQSREDLEARFEGLILENQRLNGLVSSK